MAEANQIGVGADGLRRQGIADRLQGRRRPTACRRASSFRWPTIAGRSAGWACGSTRASGAITQWLYRDPARPVERLAKQRRLPADGPRDSPSRAADRRDSARAQGGRRGADRRRDVHGPRRRARVPDEEPAAGGLARRGPLPLRAGDAEAGRASGCTKAAGPTTSIREEPYQARGDPALRRARGDRQGRHGRRRRSRR